MKPSDPRGLFMPSAEDGVKNARLFINRWIRFNDLDALDYFYNSLQEQIKIFYNLRDSKVKQDRIQWVMSCEKLISDARHEIQNR